MSRSRSITSVVTVPDLSVAHIETTDNVDSWDGYDANRRRVLDTIKDNEIDNVIVISGDSQ